VKLYTELGEWWPVFSSPHDYGKEARFFEKLLRSVKPPPRTLLELGSGGGNNAFHLKSRFAMTLVDLSPRMLDVSRALNPECEHIEGDMRSVRLRRTFDAVFVHDAICHMTTDADLKAAIATAAAHLKPGGIAVFAPDFVRETFVEYTDHGGNDAERGAVRYVQWITDPDPSDTSYIVDFGILIREEDGTVRAVHDRHEYGLFPRARWKALMSQSGLTCRVVRDGYMRDILVGRRAAKRR
jgi:SAM-dependent methyltransferase